MIICMKHSSKIVVCVTRDRISQGLLLQYILCTKSFGFTPRLWRRMISHCGWLQSFPDPIIWHRPFFQMQEISNILKCIFLLLSKTFSNIGSYVAREYFLKPFDLFWLRILAVRRLGANNRGVEWVLVTSNPRHTCNHTYCPLALQESFVEKICCFLSFELGHHPGQLCWCWLFTYYYRVFTAFWGKEYCSLTHGHVP